MQDGFKAGYTAGFSVGYTEGYHLAAEESKALGHDLGFILSQIYMLRNDHTASSSSHWKKIEKLLDAIREVPLENTETDRDSMLSKIRAKYREVCQSFPVLRPVPSPEIASVNSKLEF